MLALGWHIFQSLPECFFHDFYGLLEICDQSFLSLLREDALPAVS